MNCLSSAKRPPITTCTCIPPACGSLPHPTTYYLLGSICRPYTRALKTLRTGPSSLPLPPLSPVLFANVLPPTLLPVPTSHPKGVVNHEYNDALSPTLDTFPRFFSLSLLPLTTGRPANGRPARAGGALCAGIYRARGPSRPTPCRTRSPATRSRW